MCEDNHIPMSPQSPKERLEHLRRTLKGLDEYACAGEPRSVAEIKRDLLRQICHVERIVQLTMRRPAQLSR
jgi:hypothetical protein